MARQFVRRSQRLEDGVVLQATFAGEERRFAGVARPEKQTDPILNQTYQALTV